MRDKVAAGIPNAGFFGRDEGADDFNEDGTAGEDGDFVSVMPCAAFFAA